jgi:hypothetical protein
MKILGYSSYTNEQQYSIVLPAYKQIANSVEMAQIGKRYGTGLDLLLIFYNFEAVPNEFIETDFLVKKFELQRYNTKERSLRLNVFVGYEELTSKGFEDQVNFYFNTTMHALKMVIEKFSKRKNVNVNVDFSKLYEDIERAYLSDFPFLKLKNII